MALQTIKIANGDWVVDPRNGRPVLIDGRDKLDQDLRECLTIATQTSGFGAGLDGIIGAVDDPFAIRDLISTRIRTAVTAMQRLQNQYQLSQRPANERVRGIIQLEVTQAAIGTSPSQTGFAFRVVVASTQGTTATTQGVTL